MDIEKLKKDRKILKEIDSRIAYQSSLATLGYLVAFSVLLITGQMFSNLPKFALFIGFILLSLTALRVYVVLRIEHYSVHGPARWRRGFLILHGLHTFYWSVLVFVVTLHYGESRLIWVICMIALLTTILNVEIWIPYKRANQINITLVLVPLILAFCFLRTVYSFVGAFVLLVTYIALIKRAEYSNHRYWGILSKDFELKEKNRDLELTKAKLVRLSDIKMDFVTDLTHEIRMPLNSVLGMMTLLSDTDLDDNQREILMVSQHSGESLLHLIDDILDFSRIAAGTIALASTVFNLRKCVDETLETLGPMAHAKGIEISAIYDSDMPLRVRGDPLRIGQVLSNLINNAIKFSDAGEIVVTVHMTRLSTTEGLLRLQVIDQGEGIPPDKQDQLFRAFHKAKASTGRKGGGTGLGLAICKGLVEAMHGQIGLISEESKGSTFWFTAHLRLSTQQSHSIPRNKVFYGLKVLIVGAPSGLSESLKQELKTWEMEVETSDNGYDNALQLIRTSAHSNNSFDLIILNMDHRYKGILKLVKTLAEEPALHCKQLILTTLEQRGDPNVIHLCEKLKSVHMMTKPVQRNHLYQILMDIYHVEKSSSFQKYISQALVGDSHNYKILLMEDNKVNQMVAKGMLIRLGYGVCVVDNSKEAISLLQHKTFDLILLDCHMLEMDVYSVTQVLYSQESATSKHIPVIGMTTNAADGEETRCLAAGMDDILIKPINIEELDSKLRLWLGQDRVPNEIINTHSCRSNTTLH